MTQEIDKVIADLLEGEDPDEKVSSLVDADSDDLDEGWKSKLATAGLVAAAGYGAYKAYKHLRKKAWEKAKAEEEKGKQQDWGKRERDSERKLGRRSSDLSPSESFVEKALRAVWDKAGVATAGAIKGIIRSYLNNFGIGDLAFSMAESLIDDGLKELRKSGKEAPSDMDFSGAAKRAAEKNWASRGGEDALKEIDVDTLYRLFRLARQYKIPPGVLIMMHSPAKMGGGQASQKRLSLNGVSEKALIKKWKQISRGTAKVTWV